MNVKDILIKNCIVQIHKGNSSIWSTPWCNIWNEIHNHLKLPITVDTLPNNISDLWNPGTSLWNANLINKIFDDHAANSIRNIVPVPSESADTIKWKPSTKGECSTKEAFKFLNKQLQVQLPSQGSRSITPGAMHILRRVWKQRYVLSNIKNFLWRLIRRALATGERAGKLSLKIEAHCAHCGITETDSHLFFHCDFSRAVWFSARPSLKSSFLLIEHDGVQVALESLITPCTSDQTMLRILMTLWYIWRARNDLRFRKQKWSVMQVHYAVQAHINTMISAFKNEGDQHNQIHEVVAQLSTPSQVKNLRSAGNHNDVGALGNHNMVTSKSGQVEQQLPSLFEGAKCYTDASLVPDDESLEERHAGLGIFIRDPRKNLKLFIRVHAKICSSVLMAEALAMSLASKISARLDLDKINYFTDNLILASYLNGGNMESPSDWRIKPYTQIFINNGKNRDTRVLKIDRRLNITAHSLATQAFKTPELLSGTMDFICNNPTHKPECLLYEALKDVILRHCNLLAAVCCLYVAHVLS